MDMPESVRELNVELGERRYPIFMGQGLLGQQDLNAHVRGDQIMVVSNDTVAPLYLEKLTGNFPGKRIDHVILPDGERHKNWKTLNQIFDRLLENQHTRTTTLVALGGGVVGDMAGFAAASYQRGVPFIQIPTTLLAQVDSSVGGKTGINHPLGKNMIGAFHQPEAVLIDTDTLATLPSRELPAGLAEVIKYGLIREPDFLSWLEQNIKSLTAQEPALLVEAIYRSCQCKADVVAEDEREVGVRATLNLGHTFGHAIETHTGYGSWLHGEAVGVGLMMAVDLSARLGYLSDQDVERTRALLQQAGLSQKPPDGMRPDDFRNLMAVDKKNVDGALRLVLLEKLGTAMVTSSVPDAHLQATLEAFCVR